MTTNMTFQRRGKERPGFFVGSDRVLNTAVLALLFFGVILVYAATRDWFAANNLDPQYYLKRQLINVVIGSCLQGAAWLSSARVVRLIS